MGWNVKFFYNGRMEAAAAVHFLVEGSPVSNPKHTMESHQPLEQQARPHTRDLAKLECFTNLKCNLSGGNNCYKKNTTWIEVSPYTPKPQTLIAGFPKIRGTFLGDPTIRITIYQNLYWGPPM